MSIINEVFKFAQRRHKGYRVILTTRRLCIAITRRVGNNVFGVESVIEINRLADTVYWRTVVADTLRKLRKDLRLEICKRFPYHIAAPNYQQATHFARCTLRLPDSCWRYVSSLDSLIGLDRGTKIHVVNGGPDNHFRHAFWRYVIERQFNVVRVYLR